MAWSKHTGCSTILGPLCKPIWNAKAERVLQISWIFQNSPNCCILDEYKLTKKQKKWLQYCGTPCMFTSGRPFIVIEIVHSVVKVWSRICCGRCWPVCYGRREFIRQLTLLTRARRIIIFEGVITVSQVSDKCRCCGALGVPQWAI